MGQHKLPAYQSARGGSVLKRKEYGYKNDHSLRQEKIIAPSIVRLQRLLADPRNQVIKEKTIKGKTFEECIGILAAEFDIALDGAYTPEDIIRLCEILGDAIEAGKKPSSNPHLQAPELKNVELVERAEDVSLEEVGGAIGTISGDPVKSNIGGPYTICNACITSFDCCQERSCKLGTPAVQLGETKQKLEQLKRSLH